MKARMRERRRGGEAMGGAKTLGLVQGPALGFTHTLAEIYRLKGRRSTRRSRRDGNEVGRRRDPRHVERSCLCRKRASCASRCGGARRGSWRWPTRGKSRIDPQTLVQNG